MSISAVLFVAAYFAGLASAFLRDPRYGLYTYVAVFYLHPPSRWWAEALPDLRWAFLAAGVTAAATLIHSRKAVSAESRSTGSWLESTPARLWLCLCAWIWIQSLWAVSTTDHAKAVEQTTKYLVVFYLIYRLIDTPERVTTFMLVNLAGCVYLGWLAFTGVGSSYAGSRLNGVGGPGIDDANSLSMQLGTAVIASSMMVLVLRGWRQIASILAMPLILNTIVMSGSRGSMLGILAGGLVLLALKPVRYKRLFYAFALAALLLFTSVASEQFWDRFKTVKVAVTDESKIDGSAQNRLVLIEAQFRMLRECFPHGCGHRGTAALSPRYLDTQWLTSREGPVELYGQRSSHNTYMSVLVEQGLPGVIIWLGLLGWWIRSIWKLRKAQRGPELLPDTVAMHGAGLAAALAVVLAAGMFTDYLMAEVQIWLFALLATVMKYVPLPASNRLAEFESAQAERGQRAPLAGRAPRQ